MKKTIATLGLALMLGAAPQAYAFDVPEQAAASKDMIGSMGTAYQRYATMLGFSQFAWGNATKSLVTLKYLAPNDTLATAKSVVVISVYSLTGVPDDDAAKIAANVASLESLYKKSSTMIDDKVTENQLSEKTLFTQFYYGEDPKTVYVAAAYLRTNTRPSQAAFIQLQSAAPIPVEKALVIEQFIDSSATLPPKKKKAFDPTAPITPEPESITK